MVYSLDLRELLMYCPEILTSEENFQKKPFRARPRLYFILIERKGLLLLEKELCSSVFSRIDSADAMVTRSCCFYDEKRVPTTAIWIAFNIALKSYRSRL